MKDKIIIWLVRGLAMLTAGYYVGLFLYIAISRIAFPFPFDWVEGAILAQSNRVLMGQALYVAPSAAYVPLVYPPLYFYLSAAFIKLFGIGMLAPRLLSLLSSCGCMLMIFLITSKLTHNRVFGVISAGLFAATNGVVWTWFDFAKVDMLSIFFMLAGMYCLMHNDKRSAVLAGLLMALSFFVKQSVAPVVVLIFLYQFFTQRQRALIFIAVFAGVSGAWALLLNTQSNGQYFFYTFTLPSNHRMDINQKQVTYILTSILQPIWLMLMLVLVSFTVNLKKWLHDDSYRFFAILTGATLILSIWLALVPGSTRNAFIPAYALVAIIFGAGLQYLQQNVTQKLSGNLQWIGSVALLGLCLWQFSIMQYKTKDYIPTAQDFKRANLLIKTLKEKDGEFFIPSQNYLALYVGKAVYYHTAPLGEFNGWYGKSLPQGEKIKDEITTLLKTKQVDGVYMEKPIKNWFGMICKQKNEFKSNSKFVPNLYEMECK